MQKRIIGCSGSRAYQDSSETLAWNHHGLVSKSANMQKVVEAINTATANCKAMDTIDDGDDESVRMMRIQTSWRFYHA